jgi:thermitase
MFSQKIAWCLVGILLCSGMVRVQQAITPNDPYFKYQVSLRNPGGRVIINQLSTRPSEQAIDAVPGIDLDIDRAWAITTGRKDVIVAVMDDGFCYDHPDIRDNIWRNPGETGVDRDGFAKETNGQDDDHNGYVDDVVGWDFVFDTPDPTCYVFDGMDKTRIAPYSHSLPALGIIGAKGNNGLGVAGINWDVSMMLLRIGVQGGADVARVDRVIRAIHYASDNGARVINWSGFVNDTRPEKLQELRQAIAYAASKDVLAVVAAGNDLEDLDDDKNCDRAPECFDGENLLKVAEVDLRGELYRASGRFVGGSNYGVNRVDIAAIAQNYTTDVTRGGVGVYRLAGGTSNAAPVVSGVAALMLSANPKLTAAQLKQALLDTARRLPALRGKIKSGGMVDAYRAVLRAREISSVAKR